MPPELLVRARSQPAQNEAKIANNFGRPDQPQEQPARGEMRASSKTPSGR